MDLPALEPRDPLVSERRAPLAQAVQKEIQASPILDPLERRFPLAQVVVREIPAHRILGPLASERRVLLVRAAEREIPAPLTRA